MVHSFCMRKPYELSGYKVPEKREEARELIKQQREKGRERIESEEEKTAEHLRSIALMNQIAGSILRKFGIQADDIEPEQVHLFGAKAYAKLPENPPWEWGGFASVWGDAMFIQTDVARGDFSFDEFQEHIERQVEEKKDEKTSDWGLFDQAKKELGLSESPEKGTEEDRRYDEVLDRLFDEEDAKIDKWAEEQLERFEQFERYALLHTLVHEALHLQAYARFHIKRVSEDDEVVDLKRTGYKTDTSNYQSRFISLNEAVTEQMTQDALVEQNELLKNEKYPVEVPQEESDDEFEDEVSWLAKYNESVTYPQDRKLMRYILEKIAEKKEEPIESVWDRFSRGYLEGTMAHLGDIERTFGRGTLKFYAGIFPEDLENASIRDLVYEYFESDSDGARDAVVRQFEQERIRAYKRGENADGYEPPVHFDYGDEFDDDSDDDDENEDE